MKIWELKGLFDFSDWQIKFFLSNFESNTLHFYLTFGIEKLNFHLKFQLDYLNFIFKFSNKKIGFLFEISSWGIEFFILIFELNYLFGSLNSTIEFWLNFNRPRLSPRRTPSPMDVMQFNIPSMQTSPNFQIPYLDTRHPQPMLHSACTSNQPLQMGYQFPEPQVPIGMNNVPPEPSGLNVLQPINNTDGAVGNMLDLDNQQYSFELNLNQLDSAELAMFGTPLSDNLSTGLSISDKVHFVYSSNFSIAQSVAQFSWVLRIFHPNGLREMSITWKLSG